MKKKNNKLAWKTFPYTGDEPIMAIQLQYKNRLQREKLFFLFVCLFLKLCWTVKIENYCEGSGIV